ncbi:MAG: hypothetical protein OXS35_07165 [Dehalococcoidia bacterium]|nr:hypothetical protein [Dehalococcoidia bacterium]
MSPEQRPRQYDPDFSKNPAPGDRTGRVSDEGNDGDGDRPRYRPSDEYSEPSGGFKGLQIGCGALIVVAIVLAVVLPLAGTFGSGGGDSAGRAACERFADLLLDVSEREVSDAEFIERVMAVAETAEDSEPPIREASAALLAAVNSGDVEALSGHAADLVQACGVAGYWRL